MRTGPTASRVPVLAALASAVVAAACGCTGFERAAIPPGEPFMVTVKSARLPPHVGAFAGIWHHSWFDVKEGAEDRWTRIEINSPDAFHVGDVLDVYAVTADAARAPERWGRDVHLHHVLLGDEARRAIASLRAQAGAYEDRSLYRAWPGPNSNTLVARLGREAPGLRFPMHHNAAGKDYGPFRAGLTTSATGIALDAPVAGLALGLCEGVEMHFLELTFGVALWPPALELPFLPRLGFPARF